ncbi:MAG: hypothetical protein CL940_03775 [Deltaproteobacteria bacterium]|nr:hypothetical protein [Deltaproteobacteria bacterium]
MMGTVPGRGGARPHPTRRASSGEGNRLMGTGADSIEPPETWAGLRALIDGGEPSDLQEEALVGVAIRGEVAALVADLRPALAPALADSITREVFIALQLDRALQVAAEALSAAGLEAPVIVKGYAAARLVYENPNHRVGVDIDVLVTEEAFDQTLEVLRQTGFRQVTSSSLKERHGARPWEEELAWVTEGGSVSLDVHRKLAASERFEVDHDGIRDRAVALDELPWPVSHPEDTLLHTALHMATNRYWVPLKSWVDLRRLLAHEEVDLDRLFERAKQWRMRSALWAALWVCERWFPGSIPPGRLETIEPPWGVRMVLKRGLGEDGHRPIRGNPRGLSSQLLYGPLLSDDLRAAVRWFGESARQAQRMASTSKPG